MQTLGFSSKPEMSLAKSDFVRRPWSVRFRSHARLLAIAPAAAFFCALQLYRTLGGAITPCKTCLAVHPTGSAAYDFSPTRVTSPSGALRCDVELTASDGGLVYSISSERGPVILNSKLSLSGGGTSSGDKKLLSGFRVTRVTRNSVNKEWKPLFGERAIVPDRYHDISIGLSRTPSHDVTDIELQVRVYDEAVAFRFRIPADSPRIAWQDISSERVEFNLPKGAQAYYSNYAQGTYDKKPISNWNKPAEPPLTVELADGQWASILEAAQVDFAHMTLTLDVDDRIVSRLDGQVKISHAPYDMPWRVVMVAQKPGDLLEHNYVVLNLNAPNQLGDTTWIKPGRVIMAARLETKIVMNVIDFAAAFNIDYVELDTGWYGNEYDPKSDATTWNATLIDLPKVIAYAKSKGRKFMLYVNHIELERHLEEVLDALQEWGVEAIKFGFVNVGSQRWTNWLHHAIVEAAKRKLVVDVHDNYRSTGFHRTYPNLLQVEGIFGDEQFPTAYQSTIYPFTRFVTGPADHTYCFSYFKLLKSKAHQLALTIVNFGPMQFLFWYDWPGVYKGDKLAEVELWRDLPTVWDDTRVLEGRPGELVTVARKRSGDWWVGSIANETAQTVEVDFSFLERGKVFDAVIYEDAPGGTVANRTAQVQANSKIQFSLGASGGVAIRIRSG